MINIRVQHFFYVSNILSILRLILVFPIWILLSMSGSAANYILLSLVAFAILTDYLDGFFARLLKQTTDLGKILDPLADKILMVAGLAGFVIFREFPLLLVVLLGYRDLVILVGGILLSKRFENIPESNIFGKANTLIISLAGFCFLVAPGWMGTQILIYVSYISIGISGVSYILSAFKIAKFRTIYQIIIVTIVLVPVAVILYLHFTR